MEQQFNLLYFVPGMDYTSLGRMPRAEREWMFKRLQDQKEREAEAYKRGSKH